MFRVYCVALVVVFVVFIDETTCKKETTPEPPKIKDICAKLDADCKTCLKNKKCLWCGSNNGTESKCVPYPVGQVIPHRSVCNLRDARWGVCWMNYQTLLIIMGTIAGILLLTITACCINCCCCRGKKKGLDRYWKDEARMERQREERRVQQDERRAERQSKYDDIRRKYGLTRNENAYTRFENS